MEMDVKNIVGFQGLGSFKNPVALREGGWIDEK